MDLTGRGFYGEINVLIFLKKLNGNYDLLLSPSELYEFYLYLDSLKKTLDGNHQLIQQIFDKVYNETDLYMANTVSIGNHMSLNLSNEYGVTLFEALCVTMNHLCQKLQLLISDDNKNEFEENEKEDIQQQEEEEMETGSVIIHDINEDKEYIINCALIIWDIIKLLLKYNIKIYHCEANYERISYYTITTLYQSFLILFDNDPFKGDIIDRYIALILKSINFHSMTLINHNLTLKQKNGYKNKHRDSIDLSHRNNLLEIDCFMPSILTITGDPGIVLCDFWFGGAFPTNNNEDIILINDNKSEDMSEYSRYDGCPSPEMVMNLWFRGFNVIDFCFASEDIVTEYDYCDMVRNKIDMKKQRDQIWSLQIIHTYGHKITAYLWVFKMMHAVIKHRFIALMRVYLNDVPERVLNILSKYHLGLELNGDTSDESINRNGLNGVNQIWNDEELTYYAMLNIFDIRSDWKSWIATKILPELNEYNLSLIKKITSNDNYPEITAKWNNKFISQIYNVNNSHFMQYVFIYNGHFNVETMRLLIAINSYNYKYINYLISFTNFNYSNNFWSLWNNTSLFVGLLNNKNVTNNIIELILYKMQLKYDGQNSEIIINNCCIKQFCLISNDKFNDDDIIWKRLLWILLKTSKYAKNEPFKSLNVHKYGIPIICKNLDIKKLKYFIDANLLNPKLLFTDYCVRQLCAKDEDDINYDKTMKFLIVLFDWIIDKCSNEPQIQASLKQYMKIAQKYRD